MFIKTARLINELIFTVEWVQFAKGAPGTPFNAGPKAWSGPYIKINWILMLFDTSWVSCFFAYL